MRNTLFLSCLISLLTASAVAQQPVSPTPPVGHSDEFTVFNNGYIYSPQAMARLHGIVDSLNLRFKTCEQHPRLSAFDQAFGHHVSIEKPSKSVLKELAKGKSLEEVLALCPKARVTRNLLIVRHTFTETGEKHTTTQFFSPQIVDGDESAYQTFSQPTSATNLRSDVRGQWIFVSGDDYWAGFYFLSDFQQPILPEIYGRMAQYVDCLVDTSAVILLGEADWESYGRRKDLSAMEAFVDRTCNYPPRPFPQDSFMWQDEPGYAAYRARLDAWQVQNTRWLRDTFSRTTEFAALLEAALQEAREQKVSTDRFEDALLAAGQGSKALEMKRQRRVWGSCSQDDSPRLHAQSIAELAAETVQWDIFLRAHLDIMNDRFDRMTDGSYAWGRRGTYIQEVEALGVNTLDLLLGACLHANNLPKNHYFANIGRIGRALAEYSNPDELEKRLSDMIANPQLDDYNRLWMYNLYAIYQSYLPEDDRKAASADRVKQAGQTLPAYLAEKL